MKYREAFINTQKERGQGVESISHDLSLRAGLVYQVASGLFDFLPVGKRVIYKIEKSVRDEMNTTGALEVSMPIMHPSELWVESGRWNIYGSGMFKLKNRDEHEFCLAPTSEETVCQFVRSYLHSYKQLPFTLYQIGEKFRDEMRPRHGILRAKEFLMKDAYSFDADNNGLDVSYQKMRDAYIKIFDRIGLNIVPISADAGEIGGSCSEEFIAPADIGEDLFVNIDGKIRKVEDKTYEQKDVQRGIEVGHIFKLGDRYSKPMNVKFTDRDGSEKYTLMGCYGIGISRLLSSIIEQNHDENGIIWPKSVSPFDVILIQIGNNENTQRKSEEIYRNLKENCIDVLFDDRNVSAGIKFHDADLLGVPQRIIVGNKSLERGEIEFENRGKTGRIVCNSGFAIEKYLEINK